MGEADEAALVSSSGVMFKYEGAASVLEVSPTMTVVEGGSVVSMVVSGVEDGSQAWCKVGGRVVVICQKGGRSAFAWRELVGGIAYAASPLGRVRPPPWCRSPPDS